METALIEIVLEDKRIFRIFCGNSTQKKRVIQSYHNLDQKNSEIRVIANGINTVNEWNEILKTL